MKFVYEYPFTRGIEPNMLLAGSIPEVAIAAEAAGFMGLGFTEHPAPPASWLASDRGHQSIDPFVALGCAAGVTQRLRLVTCLAVAPYRNPMLLAKAAATVDQVSDGRLILGLGVGYLDSEFTALGVDFNARNALMDEALAVLRLHWSGSAFSYRGRHFHANDVIARPRPVQAEIPIWIGGNARISRERAARAQGWMPMLGPPALASHIRTSPLVSTDQLAGYINEMREMNENNVATDVILHHFDDCPERMARDVARHADAFAAFREAGVTHVVVVTPCRDRETTLEYLAHFGSTFIRSTHP